MVLAVFLTSILIGACGYIVNENNADPLLSGYNTMTKDEKSNFDLSSYLIFFRKFMLNISLYSALIYFISTIFLSSEVSVIAYVISLCIPWPYLLSFLIRDLKNNFANKVLVIVSFRAIQNLFNLETFPKKIFLNL